MLPLNYIFWRLCPWSNCFGVGNCNFFCGKWVKIYTSWINYYTFLMFVFSHHNKRKLECKLNDIKWTCKIYDSIWILLLSVFHFKYTTIVFAYIVTIITSIIDKNYFTFRSSQLQMLNLNVFVRFIPFWLDDPF